ncbi:hypothetical protein [Deinococcus peraridilitoris]|uniref:Uncharacterized protein n=1 Tax=Deinococcus peraridilitoris (strain DSM 19664 / LMG 22246 / CIP 109416 / KR-200) TaxID=937777 RepID=L0A1K1_DEIPD|nr:hypothetical protein [Deinococcus peraridilitoris]AFZ67052.1 hypothetical protein Deipe_1511 [Deinococcus peraridilitoris DSM 19664]
MRAQLLKMVLDLLLQRFGQADRVPDGATEAAGQVLDDLFEGSAYLNADTRLDLQVRLERALRERGL